MGVARIVLDSLDPPEVSGSRGGNEALADLLHELARRGVIADLTTE